MKLGLILIPAVDLHLQKEMPSHRVAGGEI